MSETRFIHRLLRFIAWLIAGLLLGSVTLVIVLRWIDPPTSAFMLRERALTDKTGKHVNVQQHWVDWQRISPQVKLAVIASEDQKFPEHHGFDFASINDALAERERGRRVRGASTISQQVAKNLFLWPGQ